MRLRYLHLPELLPLENITIRFGYEPILGRTCAIHFVVGVNGSGKSRLLRALAEVFLCIERGVQIPFPLTLIYDLGPGDDFADEAGEGDTALQQLRHTIYLHRPEQGQTLLIDFDYIPPTRNENQRDWEALALIDLDNFNVPGYKKRIHYRGDNLPPVYLPEVLLAYTSGAVAEWESLFTSRPQDILMTTFNNLEPDQARQQERPPGWDSFKEAKLDRQEQEVYPSAELYPSTELYPSVEKTSDTGPEEEAGTYVSSMGIFVPPKALKLAICAVALKSAADDFQRIATAEDEQAFIERIKRTRQEDMRMAGLRGILNEIDWLWPVTVGLRINFRPELLTKEQLAQVIRLYEASTTVIREPEPGKQRYLFFDLRESARDNNDTTADALIRALTPHSKTAFGVFQQLLQLQQQGILEDITIALRKHTLKDLILYDWLSDGEQVFIGRMAFFHLLHSTEDALILLDEPETHFNDYWKREMVDIIDRSLRDDSIEIVLSTHSSIALSDAFNTEIIPLYKAPDGSIHVDELSINSFGASPIDIMRKIFDAPESVGQRAAEFLDLLLMIAIYPEQVLAVWESDQPGTTLDQLRQSIAFTALLNIIQQRIPRALSRDENTAEQLDNLLLKTLRSVHRYTQWMTERQTVTMVDAIDLLYERLGPGYYQFEFRRRLDALRRNSNAAPN